ncbi:hypothetical protein [Pseudobacteriovorax antillogorgiicola]|uniref:Uncharacterized protein n=1 Tax=Pseudobacteriovorax antillogorgiicola TaxID=1513793 RepID=A0A1Y6CKC2_9BACT|nr:hypothetical protein [Pseudobacteriovorax antillogorgiicola]TCS46373.1 hypothetical protein EDD56_12437 [Pseudobacteriovorax antillogorgiicola]SMF68553.1 hypothetical protein SAMN06296036_12437 [Pseudobacteriovorax antillogorgiicola]
MKYITIIAAAILAAIIFKSRSNDRSPLATKDPQKNLPISNTRDINPAEEEREAKALEVQRQHFSARRKLRLASSSLETNGDSISIKLSIDSEKRWCKKGDLDLIASLEETSHKKDFLVTIQNLSTKDVIYKQRSNYKSLKAGITSTIAIKAPQKTLHLGLFICHDPAMTSSCIGKKISPHGRVLENLTFNKPVKDIVVFFQYFNLKGTALTSIPSNRFGERYYKDVSRMLDQDISKSQLKTIRSMNETLKSEPVVINNNTIKVILPYNDEKCNV